MTAIYLYENFNNSTTIFTPVFGNSQIKKEVKNICNTTGDMVLSLTSIYKASIESVIIDTRFRINSWSSNKVRTVGVVGKYSSNDNCYEFLYDGVAGKFCIKRVLNGVTSLLASKSFSMEMGRWYALKATIQGPALKIFVNGNKIIEGYDSKLQPGNIGYMTRFANADFDDFMINESPFVTSFAPSCGPVQTPVIITGLCLKDIASVLFNNTPATKFTSLSDSCLQVIVPVDATTGLITVTSKNEISAKSITSFTVT
jgi:hypothetical protein